MNTTNVANVPFDSKGYRQSNAYCVPGRIQLPNWPFPNSKIYPEYDMTSDCYPARGTGCAETKYHNYVNKTYSSIG